MDNGRSTSAVCQNLIVCESLDCANSVIQDLRLRLNRRASKINRVLIVSTIRQNFTCLFHRIPLSISKNTSDELFDRYAKRARINNET